MRSTNAALPRGVVAAFLVIVALGGSNAVAVRLGLAELPPLWAATLRFGLAAGVFGVIALVRRPPLPRGRELLGTTVYGVLNFALSYALMYVALVDAPAGVAMVVFATVPLLTLLLAAAHRLEVLSARGVLGALVAITGVTIAFGLGTSVSVPAIALLLLLLSSVVAAEGGVMVKVLPPGDPVSANLIGMTIGVLFLGGLSIAAGETPVLPTESATWVAIAYLAVVGSVGLFLTYLWLLARWTASGTAYAVLLMPLWTIAMAAVVLDEPIAPAAVVGGAIVIVGTWLGAFGQKPRPQPDAEPDPGPPRVVAADALTAGSPADP